MNLFLFCSSWIFATKAILLSSSFFCSSNLFNLASSLSFLNTSKIMLRYSASFSFMKSIINSIPHLTLLRFLKYVKYIPYFTLFLALLALNKLCIVTTHFWFLCMKFWCVWSIASSISLIFRSSLLLVNLNLFFVIHQTKSILLFKMLDKLSSWVSSKHSLYSDCSFCISFCNLSLCFSFHHFYLFVD